MRQVPTSVSYRQSQSPARTIHEHDVRCNKLATSKSNSCPPTPGHTHARTHAHTHTHSTSWIACHKCHYPSMRQDHTTPHLHTTPTLVSLHLCHTHTTPTRYELREETQTRQPLSRHGSVSQCFGSCGKGRGCVFTILTSAVCVYCCSS